MYVVVLIPLNSGLVFVYQVRRDVGGKRCLNPFEFRAGICFAARIDSEALAGLNPFEFRAGICFYRRRNRRKEMGLNPFEFRAGICLPSAST